MHEVWKGPTRKRITFYMQGEALVLIPSLSALAAGRILISSFFEKRKKMTHWLAAMFMKSDFAFQQNGPVTWRVRFVLRQMSCSEKENVRREVLHLPLSPRLVPL